jgi:hypothetical protein
LHDPNAARFDHEFEFDRALGLELFERSRKVGEPRECPRLERRRARFLRDEIDGL